MLDEGGSACQYASACWQVYLEAAMPRGQTNLCKLLRCKCAFPDADDGMQCLENSVLHGSCVWQHKAARHDARVVGEAVADNRGHHRPGRLAGTSRWCVVEHVADSSSERGCLLCTLGNLTRGLGARGVQGSGASRARFGAQDREALSIVTYSASFAPCCQEERAQDVGRL